MPQLDISTYFSQLFWLLVSFSLLYFLLSKFFLPKITFILDNRKTAISTSLERANRFQIETKRLRAEYDSEIAKAISQKEEMLEKARQEISQLIDQKILENDAELNKLMQQSDKKIKDLVVNSSASIQNNVKEITSIIARDMLQLEVSDSLVEKTLDKLREKDSYGF
jgi:F-type H+-transporting ATPase subunit b